MEITVVGAGYVGLIAGACLADAGNYVLCLERDETRLKRLKRGQVPFHEPGLEPLVRQGLDAGRLQFAADIEMGVRHGEILFIAVGTPPDGDGSADVGQVLEVAERIGEHAEEPLVVALKSTVPVGTARQVRDVIYAGLGKRGLALRVSVVSNPEFLKEGNAVKDFMQPDRIVLGVEEPDVTAIMHHLYAPFNRNRDRMLVMDVPSAELTKYTANAMLATRVSFMNEIAALAERIDADIEAVRRGIGADPRIGPHFIYAGCGYGGSCFPKDVRALERLMLESGVTPRLLQAVREINADQQEILLDKIDRHFPDGIEGRRFALWGLAFKPDTDDMREATSRVTMEGLWRRGAKVRAYDPAAMKEAQRLYPDREAELELCDDPYATLDGADALAIVTEWRVFRSPDLDKMVARMKAPTVFDGRNLFDPREMAAAGFAYYGIGRNLRAGQP